MPKCYMSHHWSLVGDSRRCQVGKVFFIKQKKEEAESEGESLLDVSHLRGVLLNTYMTQSD